MAHDFTDVLQAQKALRESEERLRVAAEVGRMYAWEWDPATDSVLRSAECAGILGLDAPPNKVSQKIILPQFTLMIELGCGVWQIP